MNWVFSFVFYFRATITYSSALLQPTSAEFSHSPLPIRTHHVSPFFTPVFLYTHSNLSFLALFSASNCSSMFLSRYCPNHPRLYCLQMTHTGTTSSPSCYFLNTLQWSNCVETVVKLRQCVCLSVGVCDWLAIQSPGSLQHLIVTFGGDS